MGGTSYAVTLASGYIFLKMMTMLFQKGIDPSALSEAELGNIAKDVARNTDVKDVIRQAKKDFKSK
jgi:hypothetical protein